MGKPTICPIVSVIIHAVSREVASSCASFTSTFIKSAMPSPTQIVVGSLVEMSR